MLILTAHWDAKKMPRMLLSKLVNTLSWSKAKRRLGAAIVLSQYIEDEEKLLTHTVQTGHFKRLTNKNYPLFEHLENIEREFVGQKLISLYHAVLIVLIRRGYQPSQTFTEFEVLWQNYGDILSDQLNIRWLISAADTFIDYHPNTAVKALMLNAVTLVNAVKIYETERLNYTDKPYNTLESKQQLFDGVESFFLNRDDTLFNMKQRMDSLTQVVPHGIILSTVFQRLHEHDNAFQRLKEQHNQKRTQWWKE